MCLAYDVTMTSQLKHVIMLSMFIGNYSGIGKFSFGIIIIMTHRLTLYMQGIWGNQKRAITLEHMFLHSILYSIDNSKTHYTYTIIDVIHTLFEQF